MVDNPRLFREQMIELMKQKEISFRMLDYKTGKSGSYLNNIATGKKPTPTIETMELIAKGLSVDPEYFDEYRIAKAQEIVKEDPQLADKILHCETICEEVGEYNINSVSVEGLSEKDKKFVEEMVARLREKQKGKANSG